MNKKTKEIILGVILTLLVVTLIGGFIISYLTSTSPILFSQQACTSDLSNDEIKYNFLLQNRENNVGLATVCFKSDKAYFKINENLTRNFCFSESKIPPFNSELTNQFNPTIILNKSELRKEDNLTIEISVKCSQKIWSLLKKNCDELSYKCIYSKSADHFILIRQ